MCFQNVGFINFYNIVLMSNGDEVGRLGWPEGGGVNPINPSGSPLRNPVTKSTQQWFWGWEKIRSLSETNPSDCRFVNIGFGN